MKIVLLLAALLTLFVIVLISALVTALILWIIGKLFKLVNIGCSLILCVFGICFLIIFSMLFVILA